MADSKSIEEAAKDVQYEVNMCFKALELYRRYTFCQPISDGTCMDSHIDGPAGALWLSYYYMTCESLSLVIVFNTMS